jgi:hypothetical protein
MKRILVLGVLLFLVACSNNLEVHENVDESLARDTMQVIEIMEKLAKYGEQPNKEQQKTFDSYLDKYKKYGEIQFLNDINGQIYNAMESNLYFLDRDLSLDSASQDVEDLREVVTHYIKYGKTVLETGV